MHECPGRECPEIKDLRQEYRDMRRVLQEVRDTLIAQTERLRQGTEKFHELDQCMKSNKKDISALRTKCEVLESEIKNCPGKEKPKTLKQDPRLHAAAAGGGMVALLEFLRTIWEWFNQAGGTVK